MLKNKRKLLSLILIVALSTTMGCTKTKTSAEEPAKESVTATSSTTDNTSNSADNSTSASLEDYELEYKNGTRFFKSEIAPKSDAEKVILDLFKILISDTYDDLPKLYIDSILFDRESETHKENFKEGKYAEEITIHTLKELTKEEYSTDSDFMSYNYMDKLTSYNPSEFKVIGIDYTIKFTDKLNSEAQWGNGRWTRVYIMVKEKENTPWKVFNIYGYD